MFNPENDGLDHINVYSKGRTSLGRDLTNFSYSPINLPEDGKFNSVEGYWYWLSSKDDKLRSLHGFKAKQYGRAIRADDWLEDEKFKKKIKLAIKIKIESNPDLMRKFRTSSLPFAHYYVYGGKVVMVPKSDWIIEYLEELRSVLAICNL